MMRSMLLSAYGHYGNSKTIDQARVKFSDHVCGKETCHVDLRSTVRSNLIGCIIWYTLGVLTGNETWYRGDI